MSPPLRISLATLLLPVLALAGGTIEGVVTLDEMKPAPTKPGYKPQTAKPVQKAESAPAIVYLEGVKGAALPKGKPVSIRQEGYQFRPALVAVQAGTPVLFPNKDDEFHNVFSYSKAKRFDLGRFRRDEVSPAVVFDKPGLVKIYCEIHQHMRCMVLVVDTPHFTATDMRGRFRLADVPAGEHVLKVLLPSEKTLEMRVTVTDGKTVTANSQ
jgi:plastocyanin